jgi:hypothetical protein
MELFDVAIMTECIGPPARVLDEWDVSWVRYIKHAISFEGMEEFPALFASSETFFFFFGAGERGCGVVVRCRGTKMGKTAEECRGIDFHDVKRHVVLLLDQQRCNARLTKTVSPAPRLGRWSSLPMPRDIADRRGPAVSDGLRESTSSWTEKWD